MKKGDRFTEKFRVTEDVYRCFINSFNDRNPLHTDSSFAKNKGFKTKIIHGNILGGFLSYFIGECLPIKNIVILSQDIKYRHPIYLNDKLNLKAYINEVFPSVNCVEFTYFFENQQEIKIAHGKFQIRII